MSDKPGQPEQNEDPFVAFMEKAMGWVRDNSSSLVMGAVGLAVLALVAVAANVYMSHRQGKAVEDLGYAFRVEGGVVDGEGSPSILNPAFADQTTKDAEALKSFETVQDKYSGTLSDVASLHVAEAAAKSGDFAKARSLWEAFLKEHPDHSFGAGVKLSLLRLDAQEGNHEAEITELRRILDEADPILPRDAVLYELASTLEGMDRKDEAVEEYQRLVDENPDSTYTYRAQQRLAELAPAKS